MRQRLTSEEEDDRVLELGDRVRLSGTLGAWATVVGARPAPHGWWYTYRSDDGHTLGGYAGGGLVVEHQRASDA